MAELIKPPKNKRLRSADLVNYVIDGIEEKKGTDIVCIDLKKIPNSTSDFFVICEGGSNTQVQAIAGSVEDVVKKKAGFRPWHIEGVQNAEWILLDYVDVVVHVFQPEIRKFYSLEDMWADAEISHGRVKASIKKKTKKTKKAVVKKKKPAKKKTTIKKISKSGTVKKKKQKKKSKK